MPNGVELPITEHTIYMYSAPGADVMNILQCQHTQFGVSVATKQAVKYHLCECMKEIDIVTVKNQICRALGIYR